MLITGNLFSDHRGEMSFINDFDMSKVVRMYTISPRLNVVRAWQGHMKETKWFYASKGSFLVRTRLMSGNLSNNEYYLRSNRPQVLKIDPGFFNGFQAIEEGSILTVFSDFTLKQSQEDDYRALLKDIPWDN